VYAIIGLHFLVVTEMQAEDGQAIMSSNLAKRQRVDDSAVDHVSSERRNDTAYMQVNRTGRLGLCHEHTHKG
jgi:hypothetical protein